jgi:type II secretory pathway pseudopilin PulG
MARREPGTTLVEVLVVLALMGVLAAGLLAFLAAGLGTARRVAGSLAAQRSLRRALAELSDDLQEAGLRIPCRPAPPPRFRIEPARPVPGPGDALWAQALTLSKDVVLPGRARLGAALPLADPPDLARWVDVVAERRARLRPGDVLLVEDGHWEGARVAVAGDLAPGRPARLLLGALEPGQPAFRHGHGLDAPVAFLRPGRLIHYGVANRGGIPCLVRLEAEGPEEPDWARLRGSGAARVVAGPVAGFRVDLPRGPGAPLPPLVRVTVEAGAPRRTAVLVRAPRNARPP